MKKISGYLPVFSWLLLFAPFRYSEIYEEAFGRPDSSVVVSENGFQFLFNPYIVHPSIEKLMQVNTIVIISGLVLQLVAWFFGRTAIVRFFAMTVVIALLIGIKTEILLAFKWFSARPFRLSGWGYFALIACQIAIFLFVSSHNRFRYNKY